MTTITFTAWADPSYEHHALHAPKSHYVDTYYLPVLGPSALWLYRNVADQLAVLPTGRRVTADAEELGRSLGIGFKNSRRGKSMLDCTLDRLVQFGVAREWDDVFEVRRALPDLPLRHQSRLPAALRARLRGEQRSILQVEREPVAS